MGFLLMAPGQKLSVTIFFVPRQCDPEVKNIAQKNHIMVVIFKCMQHPEKIGIVATGFVYMRICNDYHDDPHRNGSSGYPFEPFLE